MASNSSSLPFFDSIFIPISTPKEFCVYRLPLAQSRHSCSVCGLEACHFCTCERGNVVCKPEGFRIAACHYVISKEHTKRLAPVAYNVCSQNRTAAFFQLDHQVAANSVPDQALDYVINFNISWLWHFC